MSSPNKRAKEDNAIDIDALHKHMTSDWPKNITAVGTQEELRATLLSHDIPHSSARIEWWYINGHLSDADDATKKFSFFAAFFRLVVPDADGDMSKIRHCHAINWAVSDHQRKKYLRFSELDHMAAHDLLQLIERNDYRGNEHILAALKELAEKAKVPAPDTLMKTKCDVSTAHPMHLKYNQNIFEQVPGEEAGTYRLRLFGTTYEGTGDREDEEMIDLNLIIKAQQGPILHGRDGVVSIGNIEGDMFYYFTPQCTIQSGTMRHTTDASRGFASDDDCTSYTFSTEKNPDGNKAWIDHEFGGAIPRNHKEDQILQQRARDQTGGVEGAWEWGALQFDDGTAMSVTLLTDPRTNKALQIFAIVADKVDAANLGKSPKDVSYRLSSEDGLRFEAIPDNTFQSKQTGIHFPTKWKVEVPAHNGKPSRTFYIAATIENQEFVTLSAKPSFWEGHVDILSSLEGGSSSNKIGQGYVECHGQKDLNDVDTYFEMMHAMLCVPLQSSVEKINEDNVSPTSYAMKVAPVVEMICAMSAVQGNQVSDGEKILMKCLCAAYICIFHHGGDVGVKAFKWAHNEWETHHDKIKNDFKRLLFRSFYLRELKVVSEKLDKTALTDDDKPVAAEPEGALNPTEVDGPLPPMDTRFIIPTKDELSFPCNPLSYAVAQKYFDGVYEKSPELTTKVQAQLPDGEDLNSFLSKQGVNLVVRQMTSRLKPVLTTKVQNMEVETHIKTMVSNDRSVTPLTGRSFVFQSPGRGKLTCRACLQHNGRVLVIVTDVSEKAKEYKWIWIETLESGETAMVEQLHYYDQPVASGVKPVAKCTQAYVKKQ